MFPHSVFSLFRRPHPGRHHHFARDSHTAAGRAQRCHHPLPGFARIPIQGSTALLQIVSPAQILQSERSTTWVYVGSRGFHSTPRRESFPFIGLLALLKTSTAFEIIRTAGRIALTFIPVLVFKNHASRRLLKHVEKTTKVENPDKKVTEHFVAKKASVLQNIRRRTILFHALMFTPFALFWAAVFASLERTPLTGRWRLILLSPEEEEDISNQLAGSGWYQAVGDIIAKDGPPRLVPPSDWRYAWVRDTLRTLEGSIPTLGYERALEPVWLERGPDDVPLPPPAEYPLRPRPRASEYLRQLVSTFGTASAPAIPHIIPGPPYALIVVDDPESCNAFSYGFGPDGAGGIVVFSGFLDKILRGGLEEAPRADPPAQSWWAQALGGFFAVAPPPRRMQPSAAQTSDLAVLLAHELSHLVLSHHLETLSSITIFVPGMLSIVSDIVRTLLFPVTMFFGPFVNDAVGNLGRAGSTELSKLGEYCTSMHQEIEADVVSARLLAHAGFDPRRAIEFWENRADTPTTAECSPGTAFSQEERKKYALKIMGAGHPINEVRVEKLREELQRWQRERERVLAELEAPLS
ncbi:hypothetical protein BV25DRAFT_1898392 [Artomyces pyxidatus]|uniref:Uncharacterized protein n=1 Tax=Artomyces pyxidatus TaxID=48021 RepID=A0ACB8T8G8_9AGAM|nr:hypothetical protein BV25DRAFT_1898392 [Artomyces pyxidatus]